jgi:hypothetical protein
MIRHKAVQFRTTSELDTLVNDGHWEVVSIYTAIDETSPTPRAALWALLRRRETG